MCKTMKELEDVSKKIFYLEQKKATKKKEVDELEKEIKQLKSETASYMKKRQKNELNVAELTILFTSFFKPSFDKEAFISGEKDGNELYKKYQRNTPVERVTVKIAKV